MSASRSSPTRRRRVFDADLSALIEDEMASRAGAFRDGVLPRLQRQHHHPDGDRPPQDARRRHAGRGVRRRPGRRRLPHNRQDNGAIVPPGGLQHPRGDERQGRPRRGSPHASRSTACGSPARPPRRTSSKRARWRTSTPPTAPPRPAPRRPRPWRSRSCSARGAPRRAERLLCSESMMICATITSSTNRDARADLDARVRDRRPRRAAP